LLDNNLQIGSLRRAQIFSNDLEGLYLTMLLHETVLHYKLQKMLLVYEWFKAILVITFSFCYAKEYRSAPFEKKGKCGSIY